MKSRHKRSDSEQSKSFIAAARELGADASEAEFDRALRKVASAPPAPMPKPKRKKTAATRKRR